MGFSFTDSQVHSLYNGFLFSKINNHELQVRAWEKD